MIQVDDIIVSDDIKSKQFVCDLEKCKGACCVEGDLGAPLEESELPILDRYLEDIKPYLMEEGIKELEKQGAYVLDWENEYSTPTIGNKECVYVNYDEDGTLKCGIEQAWLDGKIPYRKPISCHLYPIRVVKLNEQNLGLNYDQWSICKDACTLGEKLGVPVYKFLKEPLIRRFGKEWYETLAEVYEEEEER
jgi:hypothetical protein